MITGALNRAQASYQLPSGRSSSRLKSPHSARRCSGCRSSPVVAELQAAGVRSLNCIATAFNAGTPRGRGHWYASQVARLLKRLAG